ncbi:hypothetical protein VNO77_21871 [Canavalia gladiata]|uniref:Uncharacterized protein n=1 Tax=Canavalia gladiata TaxID=3824 RepID=A0AAN9L1I4_CANGL
MRGQPSRHAAKMFLRHNPDSDESISDEDDDVCPNNVPSLDPTNKKPLEDEVEMPDFKEGNFDNISIEVVANSTDEEINSVDEGNTVTSTRQLHRCSPQSIRNKQVRNSEAFLHSTGSVSHSASHATCSKTNTTGTCSKENPSIWRKAKTRFLLPSSMSHKHERMRSSVTNIESLPEIKKAVDPMDSANFDGNYLENDGRVEIKSDTESAETEPPAHGFNLPSMADLFDNLQDKTDLCFSHDGQRKGKRVQPFQKNGRSYFQDTVVDSEDSPEPMNTGSSSDNEVGDQHMKIISPRKKMQTMVERFDEALGSSSVIAEGIHVGPLNSLRAGIFGKLELVMQKEKERDMDFWKKLQAGARPDSKTLPFTLSAVSIIV